MITVRFIEVPEGEVFWDPLFRAYMLKMSSDKARPLFDHPDHDSDTRYLGETVVKVNPAIYDGDNGYQYTMDSPYPF